MDVLLSTTYWPNLHYFYHVLNSSRTVIEQHEHYQKQSFRNRTKILSANGVLELSIPVKKKADKEIISGVEICYRERWQPKHWRAITSAYNNSPYFEYFEEDLKKFYNREYPLLLEYNLEQLNTILKLLKIKKEVLLSNSFEKQPLVVTDLRESIHPKQNMPQEIELFLNQPYYQTFEEKFGFTPNLSILDLLLNKGLESKEYLTRIG